MKTLLKVVRSYDHFQQSDPALSIPGDAEKCFLTNPLQPEISYIAKAHQRVGPQEILTEYFINCVGMAVPGLDISQSTIGSLRSNKNEREIRFLSLFFHSKKERLTHGIQLFQQFYSEEEISAFEKGGKSRHLYTVENIKAAMELSFPESSDSLFASFLRMCLFDAWIGNQDRHAKNWGVVEPIEKKGPLKTRFAPIYDTARGLYWNLDEIRLKRQLLEPAFRAYLNRCIPEISVETNPKINHFGLIGQIIHLYPDALPDLQALIYKMAAVDVAKILQQNVFSLAFSPLRKTLISRCLAERAKILIGILNEKSSLSAT